MKHGLLIMALFLSAVAWSQERNDLVLEGRWNNPNLRGLGRDGQVFNDCWGWTSPEGREFAIMGSIDSIYFIDISEPQNPKLCDVQAGGDTSCIHRDFKTYQHYCYAVADQNNSSLQVFDLQYLPDSVSKVYDSNEQTRRAHNIFMQNGLLYVASNTHAKWPFIPMSVLSLENPEEPKAIQHFQSPIVDDEPLFSHVHDVFVKDGIAYCSMGNDGLFIYDNTNTRNPVLRGIIDNYPNQGYNHSSWVNEEGNLLVFADENHGKLLKLYALDNGSPSYITTFGVKAEYGSVAHNPYLLGERCFVSYYHEGLQVFDVSNPQKVERVGYYDTYPDNPDTVYKGYEGCWGTYPFFPSGHIIASDMRHGLFVFSLQNWESPRKPEARANIDSIAITQRAQSIELQFTGLYKGNVAINIYDMNGRQVYFHREEFSTPTRSTVLQPDIPRTGLYVISLKTDVGILTKKVVLGI